MSWEVVGWYASIFFWLYFTGIGIPPCPEEAGILYAAGLTALHPELRWEISWPLTGAGILAADITLYIIGRFWGRRLLETRWMRWMLKPERRLRLEAMFQKHGIKLLIAARLLPPLRTGLFMIAGTLHYSFIRFVIADAVFAIVGVGVLFFLGAWLIEIVDQVGSYILWVAVPVAIVYGLYRYFRFLRARELRGQPEPPVSVLELPLADEKPKPAAKEETNTPQEVGR